MARISWPKMILPMNKGGLEFRDIQSFNDAYLAKLSWSIIQHPESLFARIMTGNYCPAEGILTCIATDSISHGWRGILIGRDPPLETVRMSNGRWSKHQHLERCVVEYILTNKADGTPPLESLQTTVADLLIQGTMEWNIESIRRILPFEENMIRAIKPSRTRAPDKLVWLRATTGKYMVKTGYLEAMLQNPATKEFQNVEAITNWRKSVWKLQTTPKIKLFIWKIFHGALPVGDQLLRRHIEVDGKCKVCGISESINHLFFECNFAQKVWAAAPLMPSFETRGMIDFEPTWTNLCEKICLAPTGLIKSRLAPWIMWQIWLARNEVIFNDRWSTPEDIVYNAIFLAREWETNQIKRTTLSKVATGRTPAPTKCAIVRSDAAWSESLAIVGLGWTISDQDRTRTFSIPEYFVVSPLAAEGLALREAITKCRDLGYTRFACESDCSQLVKSLNLETEVVELYGITANLLSIVSEFEVLSIRWIPREKNVVTDKLSKQILADEITFNVTPNIA